MKKAEKSFRKACRAVNGRCFDFTLEQGDVIETNDPWYLTKVKAIDTLVFKGEQYRRFIFEDYTPVYRPVIVEGVGSWRGLLNPYLTGTGSDVYLSSCEVDGKEIFNYEVFMQGLFHIEPQINLIRTDGMKYMLKLPTQEALLAGEDTWAGKLDIPSEITYKGKSHTVSGILLESFLHCPTLTDVTIPVTVSEIRHYYGGGIGKNPFEGASSLERIIVEEGNQWLCSADGVLFSKDMSELYAYPAGARNGQYTVPETVTSIGGKSFAGSVRLKNLMIPPSVRTIGSMAFYACAMESLIIEGTFDETVLSRSIFEGLDTSTVLYVPESEVEKFRKIYDGTVLPLTEEVIAGVSSGRMDTIQQKHDFYDLQGRRLPGTPERGLYIRDGKKYLVK